MSDSSRFNSDCMSKDQYKAWLTSLPEYNMEAEYVQNIFHCPTWDSKQALKNHATGKKHIHVVTQTQETDLATNFLLSNMLPHLEHLVQQALENHPYHRSVILKIQRFRKCGNT